MKKVFIKYLSVIITLVIFSASSSHAFMGSAVKKGGQEVIEFTARKFGIKLGEDAGKVFTEKALVFLARHGDDGARLLKHAGPEAIAFAAKHGDDAVRMCASQGDDAMLYIMKNADEALPLWNRFGVEGTELFVKHPGLANSLAQECGQRAIEVGSRLSTSSVQKFIILSGKFGSAQSKDALIDEVLKNGDKILDFLWKHKGKIAAGATLYSLLAEYENVTTEVKPDGTQVVRRQKSRPIQKIGEVAATKAADTTATIVTSSPIIQLALCVFCLWLLWPLCLTMRRLFKPTQTIQPKERA